MDIKSRIASYFTAATLFLAPAYAFAGDHNPFYLFTSTAKAVASVPVQIFDTGAKHVSKKIDSNGVIGGSAGVCDVAGRLIPKVVEELMYAITFQDSKKELSDIGDANRGLESDGLLRTMRNGAAVAAAGGFAASLGGNVASGIVRDTALISGGIGALVTGLDEVTK